MKDKLLKVKDMLMQLESVNYQIGYGDALKVTGEYEIAGREEIRAESLALLDRIISMLDSLQNKLNYYENIGRCYLHASDVAKDIKKEI